MRKVIVIGLGHAWKEFYAKVVKKLERLNLVELVGTVDLKVSNANAEGHPHGKFHARSIHEIPLEFCATEVVPVILTPDHFQLIEELAEMGFKNIVCEKPLVSRVSEIGKIRTIASLHDLKLYAVDFYLPKALGLQVVLGVVQKDDPRYGWITVSEPSADFGSMLGEIEGVGVEVIEAGDFCLPDISGRPYLAENKEIGGVILDLITHTCGPLYQAGLLTNWAVLDTSLSRLSEGAAGHLIRMRDVNRDLEMYVTALLEANGIPVHLAFGKVPISSGGLWALEVRGNEGMYFAGLRSGQPSILVGNDGRTVIFSLIIPPYEFVMREALFYFDGLLPGFDGNVGAFCAAMEVGQAILRKYGQSAVL